MSPHADALCAFQRPDCPGGARSRSMSSKAPDHAEADDHESIDEGQHIGLPLHRAGEERSCARTGLGLTDRPAGHGPRIVRQPLVGEQRSSCDVQSDQIRVDLLAHPHERLHEGCTEFCSEQS